MIVKQEISFDREEIDVEYNTHIFFKEISLKIEDS